MESSVPLIKRGAPADKIFQLCLFVSGRVPINLEVVQIETYRKDNEPGGTRCQLERKREKTKLPYVGTFE